jgi:hypothetical protein
VDIELLLAIYGHRVLDRLGVDREAFVGWVESSVEKA